jgi:hypothetical protein
MATTFTIVPTPAAGGSVRVSVAAVEFPQAFAALLWEFSPDRKLIGGAREVSSDTPSVSLGSPAVIDGHFYFIEGRVLTSGDDPPTPYVMEVTIAQGGAEVHTEVPSDRGSGQIGKDDAPFTYTFQVAAVAP